MVTGSESYLYICSELRWKYGIYEILLNAISLAYSLVNTEQVRSSGFVTKLEPVYAIFDKDNSLCPCLVLMGQCSPFILAIRKLISLVAKSKQLL